MSTLSPVTESKEQVELFATLAQFIALAQ